MKVNIKISAFEFFSTRTPVCFLINLLLAVMILFRPVDLSGQTSQRINPRVYDHIIRPNTTVVVRTVENGRVNATNSTPIDNVMIPAHSRTVIPYEKKISVIDNATYAKVRSNPEAKGVIDDYKIIPELHVENSGTGQESFRIVFTLTQPFRYNFEQKVFNATMGFFLLPEGEASTANITEPVNLEVVSNAVKTITPDQINLLHLNLPSSKVELIADKVSDSAEVKVITVSNPAGYTTYLKVEPTLELLSERSSLQGYSIQTIPVQVRFIGSTSRDSTMVTFSASKGSVTPVSMYVSYNKPSTIYVRSEGTGQAKLFAATNNSDSNEMSFTYTFPWPFLLFSMVGGLIGGLVKYYFNSEEKKFPLKHIIGGILIGFIVAVAYYFLGINLIGLNLNAGINEIAVLGLSALGAYFGIITSPKPPAPKP